VQSTGALNEKHAKILTNHVSRVNKTRLLTTIDC